jgi:magnesium transporter
MKVLTIVSTIFVPLTFITSLYGMNFEFMPELHKRWGYPIVIAVMILTAGMMLYYFRRKKWL